MTTLSNYTLGEGKPLAVKLVLHKGNRKRHLWLPRSVLFFNGSRIDLREEWLWLKTIKPVLDQGWKGVEITHAN